MVFAARHAAQNLDGAKPVLERLDRAQSEAPVLDAANIGWALHALQNAFFELLHAKTLEEGLVRTVGRGGDTDTNGAITGALLGAVHGAASIPLPWRRAVLSCRATEGSRQPRPTVYWGVVEMQKRETVFFSRWIDLGDGSALNPTFGGAVVEPDPADLPLGTDIKVDFRGATSVTDGASSNSALATASALDPYGNCDCPDSNSFFPCDETTITGLTDWTSDLDSLSDMNLRFIQVRFRLIADEASGQVPTIKGFGLTYQDS